MRKKKLECPVVSHPVVSHMCTAETDGGWRVTDGSWRVTDGGWRVSDDSWRVTNGGWRQSATRPRPRFLT